jgi:hypothetical protein
MARRKVAKSVSAPTAQVEARTEQSVLCIDGAVAKLRLQDVEWQMDLMRAPSRLPLALRDALGMGTHATPCEPVSKGDAGPNVEYGTQTADFHEYFLSGSGGPNGVLVVKRRGDGWVSSMAKSLVPYVLTKQAVKAGIMPPEGMSAMPKSLERVVPVRLRFWAQPAAQAVVTRNELVKSGMFHDRLVKLVDGAIRLCVERLFLYEPTDADLNKRHDVARAMSAIAATHAIVQPMLSDDWATVLKEHAHDAKAFMLLSSPTSDVSPVVDALLREQPTTKWLLEHEDTPDARAALGKLGRVFQLDGFDDPSRIFVASVAVPGARWLDTDVPMHGVECACGEPATHVATSKADSQRTMVCVACAAKLADHTIDGIEKAVWTTAYINDLPDSAFLYIAAGGDKDEDGKTKPRSLRYFPVRDADGALDVPHARNAIARIPQSNAPGLSADDKKKLQDKARQLLEEAQKRIDEEKGCGGGKKKPVQKDAGVSRIIKADERYVLGIILEPEAVDAQNDIYSVEEIRGAAHTFMEKFRTMGLMHKAGVNDKVKILESYVTPCDMEVEGVPLKAGTWLMGVRVLDDELWKMVKDGALTGFSIGGSAIRKPEPQAQPT